MTGPHRQPSKKLATNCHNDHPICLNQESFLDLAWWQEFFKSWNGCSFLQYLQWAPLPYFEVPSDASGALGYAAVFQGHWFSVAWLPTQVSQSIEYNSDSAAAPPGFGYLQADKCHLYVTLVLAPSTRKVYASV